MTLTLFAFLLWGCGEKPSEETPTPAMPAGHDHAQMLRDQQAGHEGHQGHEGHEPLPAAEPVRDTSIYQLPVSMTDSKGGAASLGAWSGQPALISMVYTSCTAACPLIISDLKAIDAALSPTTRAATRYLLVSMDPERDTPAKLAEMASNHGLDDRWLLTRTDEDGVRQIAAVLGIRYRKLADGNYNHSAVLTLLDGNGVIDQRIDGLGQSNAELVARVELMVGAPQTGNAR